MEPLNLELLGTLKLRHVNHPGTANFRSDKIRALLAYLSLEAGRPHQRRLLADLLWPDLSSQASMRNLRKGIFYLRQTIEGVSPETSGAIMVVDRNTVQINPDQLTIDVVEFEKLLLSVQHHTHRHLHLCHVCLARLEQASTLYKGELLAGFSLRDVAPFEEWLLFWRERLHQQAISVLSQLTAAYLERREYDSALATASRQLALDNLQEEAHRQIMRLHGLNGQFTRAMAQYESCVAVLQEELGVEPAAKTQTLYQQIQAAQRGEAPFGTENVRARLHYFPAQFRPFIGREGAVRQIKELFLDPDCRLITLVGPGGMGKTRLSMHIAEQLAALAGFVDDIYFLPLAAIHDDGALLQALVTGLNVALSQRTNPKERLLDFLRQRRCLLVLDNFEQLVDSASLLTEMLAAAPQVRLLVSSHIPLQLQAERRLSVAGLSFPKADDDSKDVSKYSAVQLFVESAKYIDAGFALNTENKQAIVQICRAVQGIPLALELAAAWVSMMDPTAIAREIDQSVEFLSLTDQDKPGRHQSMTAVFNYSWQLLNPEEQNSLSQLAIFRGPFELEAARLICGQTLTTLARLLDRSLVQRRQDGRYQLHQLLRQFIEQQAGEQQATLVERYCSYYLALVADQENTFYGPRPREAVTRLQQDLANIRYAWEQAVNYGQWSAINESVAGMGRFYQIATLHHEGMTVISSALARVGERTAEEARAKFLLTIWYANFHYIRGMNSEGIELAYSALEQAGKNAEWRNQAYSLLGQLLPAGGKSEEAIAYLEKVITFYRATSNLGGLAEALRRIILACLRGSKHDDMIRYSEQAIPLLESRQHKHALAQIYNVMAGVYYERDEVDKALAYVLKAQGLYEEIEDKLDAAVVAANLASLYGRRGEFDKALASNQKAIELSEGMGDRPGLSRDLSNRGAILSTMGMFDRSLNFYYRALEIEKQLGNEGRIAYFQAGIASAYQRKGEEMLALEYYDLALPALIAQANPYHIVGPLLDKTELLIQCGHWDQARELNQQALELAVDIELSEQIKRSRILAARVNFHTGAGSAALKQLDALLGEAENEMDAAEIQFEIWQLAGDRAAAQAALPAYEQLAAQIPAHINKSRLEQLQSALLS